MGDRKFSLHSHLKQLHTSRHGQSDSASTASDSASTNSSDEKDKKHHHHHHHDHHKKNANDTSSSDSPGPKGKNDKKSTKRNTKGSSSGSSPKPKSGSDSGSKGTTADSSESSNNHSDPPGHRHKPGTGAESEATTMTDAGEHYVQKERSRRTILTPGGDTGPNARGQLGKKSTHFQIDPRKSRRTQGQIQPKPSLVPTHRFQSQSSIQTPLPRTSTAPGHKSQPALELEPIAFADLSISTRGHSHSVFTPNPQSRSTIAGNQLIAVAEKSISTRAQSIYNPNPLRSTMGNPALESIEPSGRASRFPINPYQPPQSAKQFQKMQKEHRKTTAKTPEASSSEEETDVDEENDVKNRMMQQRQMQMQQMRMGHPQMNPYGMGQPPMMWGQPGQQPQYPYPYQGQQPMYPQPRIPHMAQIGMMPMRSMAFDAPYVPLRSEVPPPQILEDCYSEDEEDDEGNCCQNDLEDGVEFSYRPKPHCRTEVTFTVEPRKQPKWLTMLNCGFRPVVNCTAPPCYLSPSNNPGMSVCGGGMVNNAYRNPFGQQQQQSLPTINQLQNSFASPPPRQPSIQLEREREKSMVPMSKRNTVGQKSVQYGGSEVGAPSSESTQGSLPALSSSGSVNASFSF